MEREHDRRIAHALETLECCIEITWRVRDLAALVHLSPSRFAHLFRQSTGVPPGQYLHTLRMTRAGQLLARTSLPVNEVMRLVGCPDPSHFARNFRRHFGEGPSEYRRRLSSSPLD